MVIQFRPGASIPQTNGALIETERLSLRRWRCSDIAPNTQMLSDADTARFITSDGKPVADEFVGWRNSAIMAGHWALHGFGMFVVEEKSTGTFVGRVGPWLPPGWPGFEIGWGIAREFRGRGYAVEAAQASIDWAFAIFEIDRIIHCIDRENLASQAVARRLGAEKSRQMNLFGHAADVWVTERDVWSPAQAIGLVSLAAEMRRLFDVVKSFQREDRIGQLVGAAIEYRAGKRQKLLHHRLRIREQVRLA